VGQRPNGGQGRGCWGLKEGIKDVQNGCVRLTALYICISRTMQCNHVECMILLDNADVVLEKCGIHSSIVRSVEIFHNGAGQSSSASTTAKKLLHAMRRLEHLRAQPHEKQMQAIRWVEHLRAQTQKRHVQAMRRVDHLRAQARKKQVQAMKIHKYK
jgi:hypothetical protein